MKNKLLGLIVTAIDKASPTLNKIGEETKELEDGLSSLVGPATIALGVITSIGIAANVSANKFRDYTLEVDNLASSIGSTTEEASVLKQLMTDWNITNDTMVAAMRMMAKNGIDPSIEGFIWLRQELDATTSAAEKLALAQKLVGEQGIKQIIPMLDQLTNQELRTYIDTVAKGNIVTKEAAEAARAYDASMKKLESSMQAFNNTFGRRIADLKVGILDFITGKHLQEMFALAIDDATWALRQQDEALAANYDEFLRLNPEIAMNERHLASLADQVDETAGAFVRLSLAQSLSSLEGMLRSTYGTEFEGHGGMEEEYQRLWNKQTEQTNYIMGLRGAGSSSAGGGSGYSRVNMENNADLAQRIGEIITSEMLKDAQLLEEVKLLIRGLPMVIKDTNERTAL